MPSGLGGRDLLSHQAESAPQRPLGIQTLLARAGDECEQLRTQLLLGRGNRRGADGHWEP